MIGDSLDVNVPKRGQMPDRNQRGVFDSGKADDGCMSFAQRLMPDQKPEQAVDEAAELLVGAVNQ